MPKDIIEQPQQEDMKKKLCELILELQKGELLAYAKDFNIFRILGIERDEKKHSKMLAWLLNPNASHTLGDFFLRQFLGWIIQKDKNISCQLLLEDTDDFTIDTESNYIDILLVSTTTKKVIAIENKINIKDHDGQLERYQNFLKDTYESKGYTCIYIYLTPLGECPVENAKGWLCMSYDDIQAMLKEVEQRGVDKNTKFLIQNYENIIRREIMNGDEELINLCNQIYQKYADSIDLIIENKTDFVFDMFQQALQEVAAETQEELVIDKIYYGRFLHFSTKKMDQLLPPSKYQGNWPKSNKIYAYWIEFNKNAKKISVALELGWKGVNDASVESKAKKQLMQSIRTFCKDKKWGSPRETDTWSKVITKNISVKTDELNKTKQALKDKLKELLNFEEIILKKFQDK